MFLFAFKVDIRYYLLCEIYAIVIKLRLFYNFLIVSNIAKKKLSHNLIFLLKNDSFDRMTSK